MYKVLRIIFCIVAAAAAACTVLIFIFFDLWGLIPLGVCIASAVAMFLCKSAQESKESASAPPTRGDFITGKVKNDEDNK